MLRMGGNNRFGGPNLRVMWSNSRLGWIGGKHEDRDESGNLIREVLTIRRMPKYPVKNRWIVEQWKPPEFYGSPESWFRKTTEFDEGNIPQLGPYPYRGDYQLVSTLETAAGEFEQLSIDLLEDIATAFRIKEELRLKREASELVDQQAFRDEKSAIEKQKQKQIADDEEWAKNEMRSPLFIQPAVTVL